MTSSPRWTGNCPPSATPRRRRVVVRVLARAGEDTGGDFPASTLEGFPSRAELAAVYLDETGRDPAALKFWHALGLWKVAVIAEGVMRRALDEPQNKAAAGTPTVARIDALVHKAREIADEAGI